ncbi:isochorismatase [Xylariaceae sp. FL0016]|nr:isochorismatase [Xylariaceae sp. FL0016]
MSTFPTTTTLLRFGPQDDQWVYDKGTRRYDLTRGAPGPKYAISAKRGPPDTTLWLAPTLTALVVVDMQNFFLHPRCNDHPSGLAAVDRMLEAVKKCRESGVKIIWLNWGLTDDDVASMPAAASRSFSSSLITPPLDNKQARYGFGSDMGDDRGRLLISGSWNADLYDPLKEVAEPGSDIFCDKDRISGLWNSKTSLARTIEAHGFRTLLFAGVNTDQCVLGTLTDAYYRGLDCIMVEDCCATKTPGGQDVTIHNTSRGYGFVIDTESFVQSQPVQPD